MYRNHNCGELNITNVGEIVTLAGWIQKIRNLGSMKFIDLRDQFGITQIVISDNEELMKVADELVTECVIQVKGKVVERSNKNPKMPTGEIEIDAEELNVLGKCKNVLPFEVNSEQTGEAREDLRLEYRFLDLRNDKLHKSIILRSNIMKTLRRKMDELGFRRNSNANTCKFFSRRSKETFWYQVDYIRENFMHFLRLLNNSSNF